MSPSAAIPVLETGIPNLDRIMGGGLPREDVLLVIGLAGTGKTTLCLQLLFHAAKSGQNVIYVSTVSEPANKLMRHMRSLSFYDESLIGKGLFLLSAYPLIRQSLQAVSDALVQLVNEQHASIVVVDGMMSFHDLHPNATEVRAFMYELGSVLSTLGCTLIITSSGVTATEEHLFPEFTMADGIVELEMKDLGPLTVRRVQVRKVRALSPLLGEHSMHLNANGMSVYPRLESVFQNVNVGISNVRMPTGMPELDILMSGGPRAGSITLVTGALGTGKTLASLQFIMEGARNGEKALFIGFRETPRQLIDKARFFNIDLEGAVRNGRVEIIHRPPVDLDVDQVVWDMVQAVGSAAPQRLVIDSISEIQNAMPADRLARGFMAALAEQLRSQQTTSFIVHEIPELIGTELDLSATPLAILSENLILMRWVEFRSEMYRIISIMKMHDSAYDPSIRQFGIDSRGLHVLQRLETAEGLLTGIARLTAQARQRPRREE